MFIGELKSLELAKVAMTQHIPGIESKLNKSGVHVVVIKDRDALAMVYRQCLDVKVGG